MAALALTSEPVACVCVFLRKDRLQFQDSFSPSDLEHKTRCSRSFFTTPTFFEGPSKPCNGVRIQNAAEDNSSRRRHSGKLMRSSAALAHRVVV